MTRITLAVLVLALAFAPAVSAEPPSRTASPFTGWLDAIWSYLDWMLPGSPTQAEPHLVPSGAGALIVPSGVQTEPHRSGAYIVPSG